MRGESRDGDLNSRCGSVIRLANVFGEDTWTAAWEMAMRI